MMQQVNIHEAKTNLSRLVELASTGEEIIIAKAGKPIARLTACEEASKPRMKGLLKGQIEVHEDFDAPLPEELLAAFEGKVLP